MKRLMQLFVLLMAGTIAAAGAETLQWKYDSSSDTYYVTGIVYCDNTADRSYEQMGIYVPAAYMNATANSDGTYTCTVKSSGSKNGYTALTAPIVMPVNTAGYKAQSPPTGFTKNATSYTAKGFIYLFAGCRGKDASALGAKTAYRDDIAGAMCWCPITNLDLGSEGYEWNMGLTRSGLSSTDQNISKALAAVYADYINDLGLKHPAAGETLTLSATDDGYYQSGAYYEYVMEVINDAVSRYNTYNHANVSAYGITDVDFETIWGQGHTQAEDEGDGTDNFIEWVEQRMAASTTGIESIGQSDNLTIGQIYDLYYTLDGRRVINPAKGLYIHHGKKVILK